MILQALLAYYQRLSSEKELEIAPEGFERKEIPFLIVLSKNGKFVDILDTRFGEDKKNRGA